MTNSQMGLNITADQETEYLEPADLDDWSMSDLVSAYNHWNDYMMLGGYAHQTDFDKAVDQMTADLRGEINHRCASVWPQFKEAWLNQ